jgi:1-acyl-sn-glycerol-3-phosphate acyltransferase
VAGVLSLWLLTFLARSPRAALALQCAASRAMLAGLGCRFVVRGAWPARDAGARLFVANHTSYLDIPIMLAALDRDFAFLTKRELLGWPFISRITRAGAHIPVDRDRLESRGAVVGRIVKALRAGRSVVVFPEGTFSYDDGLRPFHAGAFKAAVAAGVPVVPVAIKGVAGLWSQHARFPRPGVAEMWVGDALDASRAGADASSDETGRPEALRDAAVTFISTHVGVPPREA